MNMMNKLPTKQIYLLSIIVFGIIALSIYSTYAIFTFEASTSDILSIRTPGSLSLLENVTKYKQVTISKDSLVTTDVDIYNNFDYSLCYSIWYKTTNESDMNKIKIYENNENTLTTSGIIDAATSKRVKLLLINDSDVSISVKIGVSYTTADAACELNMSEDRKSINSTLNARDNLNKIVMSTQVKNSESGYLTYELNNNILLDIDKPLKIATSFDYQNEVFTLKESKAVSVDELSGYADNYTCLDDDTCQELYLIKEVTVKEGKNYLTKYNKLIGYLGGISGVRKVKNNYYFYGDNPDNFIYYNCQNELDTNTCELWRIVGLVYDEEADKYLTKIIRDDYLKTGKYDDENESWSNASIKKYLNEEYKLNSPYIKEKNIKQENLINIESSLNDITYMSEHSSKITIMNLSDYLNASICTDKLVSEYANECLTNNWLNKGNLEWTMTMNYLEPTKDPETEEIIPVNNNKVYSVGKSIEITEVSNELNLRPAIYLKERVLVTGGNGSFANPYIIR